MRENEQNIVICIRKIRQQKRKRQRDGREIEHECEWPKDGKSAVKWPGIMAEIWELLACEKRCACGNTNTFPDLMACNSGTLAF